MSKLYESVWDALEDSPPERANLRLRSDLMIKIASEIKSNGWTQAEAATKCGVNQPRINDLLRGRITRFSLDALVNIASTMGHKVEILVEA
ncbi:MAG: XRE family transcriptional regulator [Synergistaceae bacterium]|nr:XRE family transcriptional regulator [Synergistaceae bacterium]